MFLRWHLQTCKETAEKQINMGLMFTSVCVCVCVYVFLFSLLSLLPLTLSLVNVLREGPLIKLIGVGWGIF